MAALHTVCKLPDVANKFVDVGAHTALLALLRQPETMSEVQVFISLTLCTARTEVLVCLCVCQTLRPATSCLTYLCRNADPAPLISARVPHAMVPIAVTAKDAMSASNAMLCLTYLSRAGTIRLSVCLSVYHANFIVSVCLHLAEQTREPIVAAGGLAPAVSLLTPGSPADAHSYAVRLLLNIAASHALRGAVVAAGGVPPLMGLVSSPIHSSVHSAVLDTLALLSTDPQVAVQVCSEKFHFVSTLSFKRRSIVAVVSHSFLCFFKTPSNVL